MTLCRALPKVFILVSFSIAMLSHIAGVRSCHAQNGVSLSSGVHRLAEKWVPLFNGKDLNGWDIPGKPSIEWKNEHGTITAKNHSTNLNAAGAMFTQKEYKDFHFRCEVLAGPEAETTLFFRGGRFGRGRRRGYALYNLSPDSPRIAEGWGYGSLYADDFQVHYDASRLAPATETDLGIKKGDWYLLEVIAQGESITVRVNGKQTVAFTTNDPALNRPGSFGIRSHPGRSLAVRNLQIKELTASDETPAPTPTTVADTALEKQKPLDVQQGKKHATELDRAKQVFEDRTNAAMQSMYVLFDTEKRVAANQGDTNAMEILDKQRERFSRMRILPSVVSTAKFETDIARAVTFIQRSYQKEIVKHGRNGDTSQVEALTSEVERLVSPYLFDGRRVYHRDGPAVYAIQPDNTWLETKRGGSYVQFSEVARTSEYIELKSRTTDIRIRLYSDKCSLKDGPYPWRHFKKGIWVQ